MTQIINDTRIVKIRKKHSCFACGRVFQPGNEMLLQVNMSDGIQSVYWCKTCDELFSKHDSLFYDDYEMLYPYGCVSEVMSGMRPMFTGDTPEELLIHLNQETNND